MSTFVNHFVKYYEKKVDKEKLIKYTN